MKVHRNCCGLDVHKHTIAACLIREDGMGNTCKEKRLFSTMTQDLRALAQWLRGAEVSAVAMEATGLSEEQFPPVETQHPLRRRPEFLEKKHFSHSEESVRVVRMALIRAQKERAMPLDVPGASGCRNPETTRSVEDAV